MHSRGEEITVVRVGDATGTPSPIAAQLRQEGGDADLSVETMANPRRALDRLTDDTPAATVDCVVSDYQMAGMDGLELLRSVRRVRPDLPFVLYAGDGSESVVRNAFRIGATDYVQKGGSGEEYAVLAERVMDAVSRHRSGPRAERSAAAEPPVYALDGDGRFTAVGDAFVELLDYDRETLLYGHLSALCPDDAERIGAELDRLSAATGPETARVEVDLYTATGDRLDCTLTLSSGAHDGDGTGRGASVLGTLHDATERQRTTDEYGGATDDHGEATDGYGETTDDCGGVTDDHRATLKDVVLDTSTTLMSAETDELETKVNWTLQSLGEFAGVDSVAVYSYDADGDALQKSQEWTDADGSSQPAVVRGDDCEWYLSRLAQFEHVRASNPASLPNATGPLSVPEGGSVLALPMVSNWSLVGAVSLVSSETHTWSDEEVSLFGTAAEMLSHTLERRRRERELRRQNERLDEFASVVSHDLRNPLNVADGFVELARDTGDVSRLDRAADALDRMDALVNDVLELARQGRTVGETAPVDVEKVARRAWNAVETGPAALRVGAELSTVSADGDRLARAFENLIRNAVEHGSTGRQRSAGDAAEHGSTSSRRSADDADGDDDITVRIGSLDDRPGFYVEDDGPGIPSDERPKVFEQGHTTAESGSGFGLSIVEGIVEAHGWSVDVTESAGGGARFEIVTAAHPQSFDPPTA